MDKSGFLKELQKHLAVLNESEQKDISDEYTQHIDMKMANGMSETEAIKDFGEIEELASEILNAYHVNPQYGNKKRLRLMPKEELPVQELKETGLHIWKNIAKTVKTMWFGAGSGIRSVCLFLTSPFTGAWNRLKHKKEAGEAERSNRTVPDSEVLVLQKNGSAKKIIGKAGFGMKRLIRAIVWFIAACLRLLWNGCMILAAFIAGVFTLSGLFCIGVMVVLMLQGYPLAGITIAGLGGVLFCGSLTGLMFCLIRRNSTEKKSSEVMEPEVQEVIGHA